MSMVVYLTDEMRTFVDKLVDCAPGLDRAYALYLSVIIEELKEAYADTAN
jgi:hypothetical protein